MAGGGIDPTHGEQLKLDFRLCDQMMVGERKTVPRDFLL
jgi:hypothetical protein